MCAPLFWGVPIINNKYSTLGSILGSPCFWNLALCFQILNAEPISGGARLCLSTVALMSASFVTLNPEP